MGTTDRTREGVTTFGRRLNGTIVCVVDDAADTEAAIEVGRRLAEQFDARILLVNIANGGGGIEWHGHDEAGEEQRVAAGDPAEAVARIAAEEAADIIVLGARRGLRPQTLRCVLAADLAATASCPVLVAPPRSPAGG